MKAIESLTRKRYSNAEHAALLQSRCATILAKINIAGEHIGRTHPTILNAHIFKALFDPFYHEFQALLDLNNGVLQAEVTKYEVSEHDGRCNDTITELDHQLLDAKQALGQIEGEINSTPVPAKRKSVQKARFCIGIIAVFDAVIGSKYFEMVGFNFVEALAIGVCFSLMLLVAAHIGPWLVSRGRTSRQQVTIGVSIMVSLAILFYFLGALRAGYVHTTTGTTVSPFIFMILSLFAFILAMAVNEYVRPSEADRKAIDRYNKLLTRRQAAEDAGDWIKAQIAATRNAKSTFRVDNSSIIMEGATNERLVITNGKLGYANLKQQVLRYSGSYKGIEKLDTEFPFIFHTYFPQID